MLFLIPQKNSLCVYGKSDSWLFDNLYIDSLKARILQIYPEIMPIKVSVKRREKSMQI